MLVAVTKKMVEEINKRVKPMGYKATVEIMTPYEFSIMVGNWLYHNEDFNETTGKMQVIKITYPDNCYAVPRYLTTMSLRRIYRKSDGTYDDFMNELVKAVEI